ncbi:hypothetical protein CIB48_g10363 [Xylaria polymorpha]|nr:hypothetical protein CIB48_g10363 [Xylaria polymorpha]
MVKMQSRFKKDHSLVRTDIIVYSRSTPLTLHYLRQQTAEKEADKSGENYSGGGGDGSTRTSRWRRIMESTRNGSDAIHAQGDGRDADSSETRAGGG